MKVIVLNGSPKGDKSLSLFYAKYLMHQFTEIEFVVRHVSSKIKILEKDTEKFDALVNEIRTSDAVLWVLPVYVLSVPGQVMQFYELIEQRCESRVFENKFVSVLCSSMNYFDFNAFNYIQAKTEDLNGKYYEGLSVGMFDLKKTKVRKNIKLYFSNYINYIAENRIVTKRFFTSDVRTYNNFEYNPKTDSIITTPNNYKIIIVSNSSSEDHNLNKMIEVFQQKSIGKINLINVNDIELKGGCLGCLKCSQEGTCVYNDEYEKLKPIIKDADSIIYALKIKNRAFGSRFKLFMDRSFSNGHRVKQSFFTGYLISGLYSNEIHAQSIVDGITYGGKSSFENNIVTDEYQDSEIITELISSMFENLIINIQNDYSKPANFYGVAAHKIFRDLVYSTRSLQRADDKYYKENGLYDFPTSDYKTRVLNSLIRLITIHKGIRKSFSRKINELMLKDLEKLLKTHKNKTLYP
jgi:multimeric flavodoxin WrbA